MVIGRCTLAKGVFGVGVLYSLFVVVSGGVAARRRRRTERPSCHMGFGGQRDPVFRSENRGVVGPEDASRQFLFVMKDWEFKVGMSADVVVQALRRPMEGFQCGGLRRMYAQ